ncbi:hypothetical protein VitviT2T_020186 [Vitis vinifera]|uniref:Protein LNK3 n=2 Tax=Vitis vinifera TaxID=29760 RepID=A0ABY9D5A1_VITVI|nr:protein LNK3 isoform X1 [Vitis vinifera]XP_059598126.1 protein LNK3 isoform X1 [Vitis vinifera]WKA01937.1 hypothetical protein VitviT2T_020186 [Vitis vinifera]|eukprot:XP_002265615.1 PREDICTED: protein LNK3 [Vitis vinifera]
MGIMDQYFGNGTEEFVVPKDLELLDNVESPDIWLQWGINPSESFGSLNKYFIMETETAGEELKFNGKNLCNEADKETSVHDGDISSGSSIGGGFTEASLHRSAFSRDRPYFQLDELAGMDQMDTIFLTSLLEDLPNTENFNRTFCFSPESQHSAMPENNQMEDMILDSQSISSNLHRMGSSKYLKTHAFSPSVDWDSEEVTTLCHNPCNSVQKDCPPVKAPMIKFLVPSGPNKVEEHVPEEISLEESVLHELEVVMEQLPEKTRICFRDALFRLAKNSERLSVSPIQNGDLALEKLHPLTVDDETLRSGKPVATESETNSIDRAVANLLFNKMDFDPQDLPTSSLVNFEQEDMMTMDSCNYSLNQQETHYPPHPTTLLQADAEDDEVPIFSQEKLQTKAELHEDFPRNGAVDH